VYAAHIAYISALAAHVDTGDDSGGFIGAGGGRSSHLTTVRANGNTKALIAIRDLRELAMRNGHEEVVLLAQVLELRDLVHNGVWTRVGGALGTAEAALGMFEEALPTSTQTAAPIPMSTSTLDSDLASTPTGTVPKTPPRKYTALEHVLRLHVAMAGVLYHTYVGAHAEAQARIKRMHEMLDGEAFTGFGEHGVVEVQLSSHSRNRPHSANDPRHPNHGNPNHGNANQKADETPLRIQVTHPRTLFSIGFLVSSVAKRDPTGRKPKRRQFAAEGVKVVDNELKKELSGALILLYYSFA
jgi:hypothetical protein